MLRGANGDPSNPSTRRLPFKTDGAKPDRVLEDDTIWFPVGVLFGTVESGWPFLRSKGGPFCAPGSDDWLNVLNLKFPTVCPPTGAFLG
jgi:hypothetical protein